MPLQREATFICYSFNYFFSRFYFVFTQHARTPANCCVSVLSVFVGFERRLFMNETNLAVNEITQKIGNEILKNIPFFLFFYRPD